MKKTLVISAFPGCGKSHFFRMTKDKKVLDSDSSLFSWIEKGVRHPDFPNNYMKHIKENLGKADIILVSSHKVVRDALVDNGIDFTLVYPKREIKEEYIQRFKNRGSDENFIKLLTNNWDNFLDELEQQENCKKIELNEGEYLSDYLNELQENRIKRFDNFLLEEKTFDKVKDFFKRKPRKDDDLGNNILDYINNNDIQITKYCINRDYGEIINYEFVIRQSNNNENDPLGEEIWENDLLIKFTEEFGFESYETDIYINDDELDISEKIKEKIIEILQDKYKKNKEKSRTDRIKKYKDLI